MKYFELIAFVLCLVTMLVFAIRWIRLFDQTASPAGTVMDLNNIPGVRTSESRWPLTQALRTLNINLGPVVFLAGLGLMGVLGLSLLLTFFPDHLPVAIIGASATSIIGYHIVSDIADARVRNLEKDLVESLDLMRASFDTGMSVRHAIQVASQTARKRLKVELLEVVARLDVGCTVEQAVARIQSRYHSVGTQLFAQALVARYESNSDFSTMLASVSRIMHDRIRQQLAIDAQLSGTRYAAIMCGLMPYLLVPVFLWQQPGWLDTLAEHPRGPTYLGIALLLQVCGFLWIRKLLRTWR